MTDEFKMTIVGEMDHATKTIGNAGEAQTITLTPQNFFFRKPPGNGQIAYQFRDKLGRLIDVYEDEPIKTGKRYKDSGYSGSIRRKRAKNG